MKCRDMNPGNYLSRFINVIVPETLNEVPGYESRQSAMRVAILSQSATLNEVPGYESRQFAHYREYGHPDFTPQ